MNDNSIKEISEAFEDLASLRKLSLLFSLCKQISNEEVCKLGDSLKNHQALDKINLDLLYCDQITDETKKYLSQTLETKKTKVSLTRLR